MTQLNHRKLIIDLLLKRDGNNCSVCGEAFAHYAPPTIDHRKPIMANGAHELDNLQLVHPVCNNRKGIKPYHMNKGAQREPKKKMALEALKLANGNKMQAAENLQISWRTLYRWLLY